MRELFYTVETASANILEYGKNMPINMGNKTMPPVSKCSICIPVLQKGRTKEWSNYRTIVLISYVSYRLSPYMEREMPDVDAGLRKGRGTRDHITKIWELLEFIKDSLPTVGLYERQRLSSGVPMHKNSCLVQVGEAGLLRFSLSWRAQARDLTHCWATHQFRSWHTSSWVVGGGAAGRSADSALPSG